MGPSLYKYSDRPTACKLFASERDRWNHRLIDRFRTRATIGCGEWLVILLFLCCLTGCGGDNVPKNIPIHGSVTFQGKPLIGGEILYAPVDENQGRQAHGKIQGDGTFTLGTTETIKGVIPGKYRVSIRGQDPVAQSTGSNKKAKSKTAARSQTGQKPLIPEKYADPQQSGLTDDVTESHSGFTKFELTE